MATNAEDKETSTILITGANGNLGQVVTRHFLNKGFTVVATVHNEAAVQQLSPHPQLSVAAVNLADEAATTAFLQQTLQRYPNLDTAFLLAGGYAGGSLADTSSQDIRNQIALNFETAFHVVRALHPHMLQQNKGRIVLVSARPALQAKAGKNMVAYGLSKSLLLKLAEYMNEEARGTNVVTTVMVPSTFDTPANRQQMPDADPGKWVNTEDFATILEFICSAPAAALRETLLKVYNNA